MKKLHQQILASLGVLCMTVILFSSCENKPDKVKVQSETARTTYSAEGRTTASIGNTELTGELVVDFRGLVDSDYVARAEKMYEELFPNVALTIINDVDWLATDFSASAKSFQAEIMSGKGPDVFAAQGEAVDLNKAMLAGVYADLSSYFQQDNNFNI